MSGLTIDNVRYHDLDLPLRIYLRTHFSGGVQSRHIAQRGERSETPLWGLDG